MKKTLALLIACCLITGCSENPERYDSEESYISSSVTSENSDSPESKTEGLQTSSNSSSTSESEPESSTTTSTTPTSKPQSSTPTSSNITSSKPQSSSSKPQSSSSKPQSSSSKPQSSSSKPQSSSSKPQSSSSKPQSSSSKPQSSSSKPQSSSSKPQSSSSKPQSSVPESKPPVEVIGPYGQRAQEAWEVEFSEEVFRLTNIERVKNGLPEFKRLPSLDEVANIRAWELIFLFAPTHNRPDGSDCFTVFEEAGLSCSAAAENIAAGQRSPEQVVNGWMNSPGHRANILDPDLDYLGVGFYCDTEGISSTNYRYYWSQDFCSTW